MNKLCVNCDTELKQPYQVYINNHPKLVTWMKKAGYKSFKPDDCDFYLIHKKKFHRNNWDINGDISLGKKYKNCYIYYWASHTSDDRMVINTADKAYNLNDKHNRNDGFTMTDNKGSFEFYIKNPQPYIEGSKFYPSHMHFLIAYPDSKDYLEKIGTLNMPNELKLDDIEMDTESVLINALPSEYHGRIHIPDSYSIPYTMDDDQVEKQLREIIRLNYPKIYRKLGTSMSISEVPIICYCHNQKCDASKKLMKKLYKHKIYNLYHYSGGLKEWFGGKKV